MIYVEMTFDAGHRIVGHEGKCARLHGHTYRVELKMSRSELRYPGFVVDFGHVKDLVNEWDHRLLLWEEDRTRFGYDISPDMDAYGVPIDADDMEPGIGVVRVPFNPTAENMAFDLAHRIVLGFDLDWCECRLWETPKAYAEARFSSAR